MKKQIHNLKEMEVYRKDLRNNSTSAEAYLWNHLKGSKLYGRKFRRQHSIEHYIVDFYCPSEKLIVELDGQIHLNNTADEYDRKREIDLENLGFTVIRFENKMVFDFLPSVLKEISDHFKIKE
ncbi:endonuclease domain-containing protein [Aequorivita sediminis]|uniref:endonuclease domain-containing protein n=1 Tax=Aequorivita sediminis TaxID=3073653 RepID=UPI0028A5EC62|nr:endonuclease domain-containing protein [Aequorivita sp. F6058]